MTETTETVAKAAATLDATPTDHYILLAVQRQREALIAERNAWQDKCQAASDYITRLRELLIDDAAAIWDLREDIETADAWAQHYQERAASKAAKVRRLKKQTRALAVEVERLTAELEEAHGWQQHYQDRGDALDANNVTLVAEVERMTKTCDVWRAANHRLFGENATLSIEVARLERELAKAQADLTDLNRSWHDERAAGLRLDGAPVEWITDYTGSDPNDAPDGDERLSAATSIDPGRYPSGADELTDIGLTYRELDAALKAEQAQNAAYRGALGV